MSATSSAPFGPVPEVAALVFVPVAAAELAAWAESGTLPGARAGYAVTPALTEAFGVSDPEDAEYTALSVAGIAALLAHGRRIVAVAEAATTPTGDDFGEVAISDLPWAAVTSLFGEDVDPAPAVAVARAVEGMTLAEAWDLPAVGSLLADTDLLWYGPAEWVLLLS